MKKYPYVPHPFIITPPLEEKKDYHKEDLLSFELILIGKCIDFLPYFIYTFDELGRIGIGKGKGKFQLKEVKTFNLLEGDKIIYSNQDKILHSNFRAIQINDFPSLQHLPLNLHIKFLTPTRLKYEARLIPYLEFHIFIRNLLRRISLLSYFHCGEELNIDYRGLIDEAKKIKVIRSDLRWFDWQRYSNRQSTKMKMGGLIGEILFEGDFKPFINFLLLGEYIHVGKGTTFGLGKYKILNLES
jgi:CRISPR-associated endoribonuclease Cas6